MAPVKSPVSGAPKLLDKVRARISVKHYSIRSEDQYVFWIRRFNHVPWQALSARDGGIRTAQELLGHSDVSATMIYTHVLNKGGRGVTSPLDRL